MKEKIKNSWIKAKETMGALRITLALTTLATFFAAFLLDLDEATDFGPEPESWTLYIILFLLLTACGSFLAETAIEKTVWKVGAVLFFGLISAWFTLVLTINPLQFSSDYVRRSVLLQMAAYVLMTVLPGIYFNYRRSGLSFRQYLLGVFMHLFRVSVITGILSSGLLMLSLIITILFQNSEYLVFRIEFLVFGLAGIPGLLFAVRNAQNEQSRFVRILVSYIVCPIIMAACAVIYIYLAVILVKWQIPSNSLFAILTVLYFVSVPVLTMTEHANPDQRIGRMIRIMYLLFLPFIGMQVYCIGIRILEYGLTGSRYLGLVLILLELLYLVPSILNREIRSLILILAAAFSVLCLATPGTNLNAVAVRSQERILKRFEEEPTAQNAKKAMGAFAFLRDCPEEFKTVFTGRPEEEISALRDHITEVRNQEGIDFEAKETYVCQNAFYYPDTTVNIEGFRSMEEVSYSWTDYSLLEGDGEKYKGVIPEEWKSCLFGSSDPEFTKGFEADLSEFMEDYIRNMIPFAAAGENYELTEEQRYFTVNGHITLYIRYMSVSGDMDDSTFRPEYFNFEAYALYR